MGRDADRLLRRPAAATTMLAARGGNRFARSSPCTTILQRLDKDGSGDVSVEESQNNAALVSGFEKLDENSDGALDKQELEQLVDYLNKRFSG